MRNRVRLLLAYCLWVLSPTVWTSVWVGAQATVAPIRFERVAVTGDIKFVLHNSPTAQKHLPETMAGGVATFDYDGDGLTDVFFTNGAAMPSLVKESPRHWNRLYRNMGNFKFRDVTESAGLQGSGYSMAASVADFDNDGHPDVFVAGVHHSILYRNRGDQTFEDVTVKSGVTSSEWAVGAAWLDFDNDGLLDLFIVNYVRWDPSFNTFCGDQARKIRSYCHPRLFEGTSNQLYRNLGDGRFADVSESSGIKKWKGKGMAVAVADYDRDGFADLFVTNDKSPNFLFHNLRNGRFEEVAFESGVALPDTGTEMSSMGADFRDLDNDGLPDVVLTALAGETFPVFKNRGGGSFSDISLRSQMGRLSRRYSGWGVGIVDFDNDGLKDIFSANSHVNDSVAAFEATEYKQHSAIFRNLGQGRFEDASEAAGADFAQAVRAHRGCAFADFDQDGRIDVVVTSLGDAPEFWRNATPAGNKGLVVKLTGTRSNRDGIGAIVRIGNQTNHLSTAVGYASSSDFGLHFGLGRRNKLEQVEILWPSGVRQTLWDVKTDETLHVREPADTQ